MSLFGITRRTGLALGLAVTAGIVGVTPLFAQEEEEGPQQQQEQQDEQMQQEAQVQEDNLLARAEESGRLTLFVRAIKQAGLAAELERKGPYTVLAPTDEAFRAHFSQDELDRLLGGAAAGTEEAGAMGAEEAGEPTGEPEDPEQRRTEDPVMEGEREGYGQRQGAVAGRPDPELVRILRAHILTGEVPSSRLQGVRSVQNVLGQDLAVSAGEPAAMAQARTEYEAGEAEAEGEREAEAEREQKQAEPAGMEQAAAETGLRIGDAAVVEADIEAGNGILHVIDGIIVPEPAEETRTDEGARPEGQPMEQDTAEQDTTTVPPAR